MLSKSSAPADVPKIFIFETAKKTLYAADNSRYATKSKKLIKIRAKPFPIKFKPNVGINTIITPVVNLFLRYKKI